MHLKKQFETTRSGSTDLLHVFYAFLLALLVTAVFNQLELVSGAAGASGTAGSFLAFCTSSTEMIVALS